MTRKDYELIAQGFRNARDDIDRKEPDASQKELHDGVSYAAEHVADLLRRTNERFNRDTFLRACGVQS